MTDAGKLRSSGQTGVESSAFTISASQSAGHQLTGLVVQHRNNLVATMQITSDTQRGSAPLLGQPWSRQHESYSCEGADPLTSSLKAFLLLNIQKGVL